MDYNLTCVYLLRCHEATTLFLPVLSALVFLLYLRFGAHLCLSGSYSLIASYLQYLALAGHTTSDDVYPADSCMISIGSKISRHAMARECWTYHYSCSATKWCMSSRGLSHSVSFPPRSGPCPDALFTTHNLFENVVLPYLVKRHDCCIYRMDLPIPHCPRGARPR